MLPQLPPQPAEAIPMSHVAAVELSEGLLWVESWDGHLEPPDGAHHLDHL